MVRLAFLDVDGVILDSFDNIMSAMNTILAHYGREPITAEEFRATELHGFEIFLRERGVDQGIPWSDIEPVIDGYFRRQQEACPERSGIRRVLKHIRRRQVPMYLISACGPDITRAKLEKHRGLPSFFSEIHGTENKVWIIAHICEDLDISPEETIFVSDMERDFLGCRELGITCVGLQSEFSTPERLRPASDLWFQNHTELLKWLKSLP